MNPGDEGPTTAYEDAPFSACHLRVCIAGTAGVFADGFGLGIIGIALSLAAPALGLDAFWQGLIGGGSLAGLFAGALLSGPAADRFGRRPLFISNMVLAGVLCAAQVAATSGVALLLLRLTIGFLLGTDYVVSKTLLAECIPQRQRGRVLGQLSVAWAGGYACAYAAGFSLLPLGGGAWRWMLLASAAPCLLIAPLRLRIPESPVWLAVRGRTELARRIVREQLGPRLRPPEPHAAPPPGRGSWRELFSVRWRTRTLVGCTFFACQVVPYFALGTFVTQVMAALHLHGYLGGLIYNLALVAGAVAGLLIVDRLPRRTFLIGSFALATLTMLLLSAATRWPAALMIALFALFAGVISAATNLVYVYLPELFPTHLRGSGLGLAIAASRIGSALSTFVLPLVVVSYGARTALGACVAVLAIGALVCQRWAPETRGLALAALDRAAS